MLAGLVCLGKALSPRNVSVLVFGLESSLLYGCAHMVFSTAHQRHRERSEKMSLKVCGFTRLISSEVEVIDNIVIWILL